MPRENCIGEQEIGLTISIGAAAICGETDGSNSIEGFEKADDALYKAKARDETALPFGVVGWRSNRY